MWVTGQVGHADSKMTLDVYAQLQQRVKRERGRAFDRLVRQAREQLYGTTSGLSEPASEANLGHDSGHDVALEESHAATDALTDEQESQDLQSWCPRFQSGSRHSAIRLTRFPQGPQASPPQPRSLGG
jgi:hypothetical protein